MAYTSVDQVMSDFLLYLTITKGESPVLSQFPRLARNRWPFIVTNWDKILKQYLNPQVQGDDFLRDLLGQMSKDVKVTKLGGVYNPFDNAVKTNTYKPLLDLMPVTMFSLTQDESAFIREEARRVSAFNITTFQEMSKYLRTECGKASQRIGLGDDDIMPVLGIPLVDSARSWNTADVKQIDEVLNLADTIDGVVYAFKQQVTKTPNLLAVAQSNISSDSNVTINNTYVSSIAVPFETSLEAMANKYLGDHSRWFELVTINNLQAPYVDLTGTKMYLLATGSGSSVRIKSTLKYDVPVGTQVRIGSAKYREENRYVERATDNKDGTMTLDLSGDSDMSKFKLSEIAYVKIFRPHTVNDLSIILVPQTIAPATARRPEPNSSALKRLDSALLAFGVDIKRNEQTGDVSVIGDGDFELVYGLPAVRQAMFYVLHTSQGELPWHKRYGIPTQVGEKWLGTVEEGTKFAEIIQDSLMQDGRYESVELINVKATPTTLALDFAVKIPGIDTVIPLSFIG